MHMNVNTGEVQALEKILEPSLNKLNQMLKLRFGNSIALVSADQITKRFDETLLKENQFFYADTSAYLPIFFESTLKGVLKISNHDRINTLDREQLFEVIGVTIEARLSNKHIEETLSRAMESDDMTGHPTTFLNEVMANHRNQNYAQSPGPNQPDARPANLNNVIPMRLFREVPHPVLNKFRERGRLNFSFLIEGQSEDEIFKMALEVHDRSNRVALVRIEDLTPDTFDDVETIHNLGPTTIYIANILKLPFKVQRGLERYFESTRDADSPQFISGCSQPISDLNNDTRILNTLLPVLSAGYLRMTQPFSFYRKENLIDFFYESLTGRITT